MSSQRPLLVLVPSGAGGAPSERSLADARTPNLDRLAARGSLLTVRTTPDGLDPGTEVGLPTLLGVPVRVPPSRGYLDAAALGIEPLDGTAAWRLELHAGPSPWLADGPAEAEHVADALSEAIGAPVHHVRGHRFVLVGPREWGDGPDGTRAARPARLRARGWRRRLRSAADVVPGTRVTVWGRPNPVRWSVDLQRPVHLVAVEGGPAVGVGRTAGLDVTEVAAAGHPLEELRSLGTAAADVLRRPGAPIVVVHSHHIDDAAHARRRADKRALIGAFDVEVTGPLVQVAREVRASVLWCPDLATDAVTGRHRRDRVAAVWTPDARDTTVRHLHPLTERALRYAPAVDGRTLLGSLVRVAEHGVA